jgi:molecular chaperone HtpG
MDAAVVRIDVSSLATKAPKLDDEVLIGKDILELLAGAMYVDPLTVYREYIQNAADSIDDARQAGAIFPEGPLITISLDRPERTVRIRDYGTGIPANQFVKRLTSIGASRKRGKGQRGFRGVGRLSGLGYCQELIFRSRAAGQSKVFEMRWSGRVLRERLRDQSFQGSIGDLVKEVATVTHLPAFGFPDGFFEVELRKVLRIKNDLLMNEVAIRSYLSQVAPVPFHPDFRFGSEIRSWLDERCVKKPVSIELNDGLGPIYHRAVSSFQLTPKVTDEFRFVEYVEHRNSDGDLLAFGWLLDHAYAGAVPRKLGLAGIRVRAGDIQVGDEQILASLYPESRFATWAVGDLHIVHPKILPNGRRDEFEPSPHYSQLQDEMKIFTREIAQRIRERSNQRNRLRQVHLQIEYANAWIEPCRRDDLHVLIRTQLLERAEGFAAQALVELAKLSADHPDRELAQELTHRMKLQLEQAQKMIGPDAAPRSDRSPKDELLAAAAIGAILQSSFKPNSVIPLAHKVLAAVTT